MALVTRGFSMLYNVSQLLREPVGSTRTYHVDDRLTVPLDGWQEIAVSGPVTLTRTLDGVLANGTFATAVPMNCDRCLQPVTVPLEVQIEEEYLPTVDPVTGARLSEPAEPTPFRIDEHHHLDLSEAIRQALVLNIPMTVLCRPECRGICPTCGADRNVNPCTCGESGLDERWAALRGLRTED